AVYENRFLLSGPGPATASILIGSQQFAGQNWKYVYDLSVDGGRTFKHLDVLDGAPSNAYVGDVDYGGPYSHGLSATAGVIFAVPTSDYNGAWMIQRQSGKPTKLSRHTLAAGTEVLWTDVSGPEVEALHTAGSPDKLLIQVHRRRAQVFIDPALALWRVGEPAPTAYDELFLNESVSKGFVHVDVDNLASGAPFAFDSGVAFPSIILSGGGGSAGGGGGDVVQEWGVVRGSLKQRLVLPGIAR